MLARPEVVRAMTEGVQEAFREGSEGAAEELRLFIRPWGFALSEIALPVYLWHGGRDTLVPCVAAERLAQALPRCRVEILPEEGHYLVYAVIDRLLAVLRREVGGDALRRGATGTRRRVAGRPPLVVPASRPGPGASRRVRRLRALAQQVVGEHDREHRLADRHRADADAGVVAAGGRGPRPRCRSGRSSGAGSGSSWSA